MNPIELGKLAGYLYKEAIKQTKGRSGRIVKDKEQMQKHLHAAGQPKMNTGSVFAFPRGKSV